MPLLTASTRTVLHLAIPRFTRCRRWKAKKFILRSRQLQKSRFRVNNFFSLEDHPKKVSSSQGPFLQAIVSKIYTLFLSHLTKDILRFLSVVLNKLSQTNLCKLNSTHLNRSKAFAPCFCTFMMVFRSFFHCHARISLSMASVFKCYDANTK